MRTWSIWLAVDTSTALTEAIGAEILARLKDYAAIPAAGYLNGRPVEGRIGVQMTVEAPDLLEAQSVAHAVAVPVLKDAIPGVLTLVHMETMADGGQD